MRPLASTRSAQSCSSRAVGDLLRLLQREPRSGVPEVTDVTDDRAPTGRAARCGWRVSIWSISFHRPGSSLSTQATTWLASIDTRGFAA